MNEPMGYQDARASIERFLAMSPGGPLTEKARVVNLVRRLQVVLGDHLPVFCADLGVYPRSWVGAAQGRMVDLTRVGNWLREWRERTLAGTPTKPQPLSQVGKQAG